MKRDQPSHLNIALENSPVYELVISLRVYLNKKDRKILDLGQDWVKQVDSQLSSQFKAELERARAFLLGLNVDLPLIYVSPEKDNIPGFLKWLENLDFKSLKQNIQLLLQDSEDRDSFYRSIEKYQAALGNETGIEASPQQADLFHERTGLDSALTFFRDQLFSFWKSWYEEYFSNVEREIAAQLKQNVLEKKELLDQLAPMELFEQATNGMYLENTDHDPFIVLIPQYHSSPFNIHLGLSLRGQTTYFYFYPIDLVSADANEPSPKLLRMVRCISDLNRLKILRFVYQKQKSFMDIVHELGLAKSTVHHHMVVLRAAGLVRVYVSQDQGARYSLRESKIGEISALLTEFVTQDSVSS